MSHKRFNTRNIVPLERCFYDLLQKKKRNKMPGNGKEKKKEKLPFSDKTESGCKRALKHTLFYMIVRFCPEIWKRVSLEIAQKNTSAFKQI